MKTNLKDFLTEQAKLGIKVPKIFESELDRQIGHAYLAEIENSASHEEAINSVSQKMNMTPEDVEQDILKNTPEYLTDTVHDQLTQKYGTKQHPDDPNNLENINDGNLDYAFEEISKVIFEEVKSLTIHERKLLAEKLQLLADNLDSIKERFFNNIKNALTGTIEFNVANNYTGSAEAQAFAKNDKRGKVQIETLTKKGMTPEEATAAVMYVFDKNDKNALGFVGKQVTYNDKTKILKIGNTPGLGGVGIGQ